MQIARLILGSRSPRRRELLELLIPPESIDVLPPRSSDELGFDGLTSWLDIARRLQQIAQSHVWFREDAEPLLDWYLATNEPLGKAGGYALQGLGSVFVTRVEGSITNVVGLPLEAITELLPQFGWPLK